MTSTTKSLQIKDRLIEIIRIAKKLGWFHYKNQTGYPSMRLSEVEKCMIAMNDDKELNTLRAWNRALLTKGNSG